MFFTQQNLHFSKMEGLGNDYVYVNCLEKDLPAVELVARAVSDRHFGVGSDGLILICRTENEEADYRMRMFNSDGSDGGVCGNGLRCFGRYLYDKNICRKEEIKVETSGGIVKIKFLLEGDQIKKVRVNMGPPRLKASEIPINASGDSYLNQPYAMDDFRGQLNCVSMGNPHAVFFVDKITDEMVLNVGPKIEKDSFFPARTNVEFVEVINEEKLKMRVWERGSGETLACGTGACAVFVAGVLNNLVKKRITVELLGGDLDLEWSEDDNCIYQEGPANWICEGVYNVSQILKFQG